MSLPRRSSAGETVIDVECSCHSEMMRVAWWHDDEDKFLYLSMYEMRARSRAGFSLLDWRQRLRHIWRILRHGDPWADDLILTQDEGWGLMAALNLWDRTMQSQGAVDDVEVVEEQEDDRVDVEAT